jgi:hypothetical protein
MGLLENNINTKRARVGLSTQVLGALVDLSENVLGRGLQGSRPLPGPKLIEIDKVLNDLLQISRIISPFLLPAADLDALRVLLERYRASGFVELVGVDVVRELRERLDEIQSVR